MKHTLSPYPINVRLKSIAYGSQVFQNDKYMGDVEKRNNWGIEWVARSTSKPVITFRSKIEAVNYLLEP